MHKVALSVVSTDIKTLEIFSLEFVWSGPTEQNLNLTFYGNQIIRGRLYDDKEYRF